MRRVSTSEDADRELVELLSYSAAKFGRAAANRYQTLIYQAFADLAWDPHRPGVRTFGGISSDLHLYPIRYSRNRVAPDQRVDNARHVIAFRFDNQRVEIVHLLHDARGPSQSHAGH